MYPTLELMSRDMRLRGLRPRTIEMYLFFAKQLADRFASDPARLERAQVEVHFNALLERGAAPSTRNTCRAALKFLFEVTLRRPQMIVGLPRAKSRRTLPVVLSGREINRLLKFVRSPKYRAIFATAYGAGLRIGEVCALRVDDIDSKRMLLRVRDGKTGDRYVMLSPNVLKALREYWRAERPSGPCLFPGNTPGSVLTRDAVAKQLRDVARLAGLKKRVTPHTLRHTFATHMLDLGADIRTLQVLLGHSCLQSTAGYLHLSIARVQGLKSPIDLLGTARGKRLG